MSETGAIVSEKSELSRQEIKARATEKSFQRGLNLFHSGAVTRAFRRGKEINARCRGSYPEPYRVWAAIEGGQIVAVSCDCEYDWGGDCKHIVALLLSYAHHPERFEEGKTLIETLLTREKEDLIGLIEEMIIQHPELEYTVESWTMNEANDGQNLDLDRLLPDLRQELKQVLEAGWQWMDRVAEDKVYELTRRGSRFARRGETAGAIAVYCAILDECNAHDYPADDEGQYVEAINSTVDHLKAAMAQYDFADDEALRRRLLDTLVDTLIWDIEFGGIEYGYEAEALILGTAQAADLPRIREHINLVANRRLAQKRSSKWGDEAYENFLMKLDGLDATEAKVTLQRLQAKELHYLYASKLLELERYEEAGDIIKAKLQSAHELLRGLDALVSHQRINTAIELAKAALAREYDKRLATWLIDLHKQLGNQEAELHWEKIRMREEPKVDFFADMQSAAESLNLWQTLRPQFISELEDKEDHKTLTSIHLQDEDWDSAWETLEKFISSSNRRQEPGYYDQDFAVAKASRHVKPAQAIPIYIKYARAEIFQRTRKRYAVAADLLAEVRKMYEQLNDSASWDQLIADFRQQYERLPALQDELDKAGL